MLEAQIYFDKDELHGSRPLSEFIMKFLIQQDIAGATAFKGEVGFGKNQVIKNPSRLFSFDDPPMVIVFVDEEDKVRSVLNALRKEMSGGFITVHRVEKI